MSSPQKSPEDDPSPPTTWSRGDTGVVLGVFAAIICVVGVGVSSRNQAPPSAQDQRREMIAEGELRPEAVVNQWLTTASDGKNYRVAYYSLEAILAVGYRVRSPRGTQFRRWATERLAEYLVKGFTLDVERLKNPPVAGSAVPDRFDELLERIRDIRASERRMYLREIAEEVALARSEAEGQAVLEALLPDMSPKTIKGK